MLLATACAAGVVAGLAAQGGPGGTPGEPNCHGQTIAGLAKLFKPIGAPGIGNVAKAIAEIVTPGFKAKDVQALARDLCAP